MNHLEQQQGAYISVPITIHFGDTDPYGVVYFASYFRYCHRGIEAFMNHLGLPPQKYFRNTDRGFGLPVVGATCDFYRPVWYGDKLILRVYVKKLKDKSVTFGFIFFKEGADEPVAKGEATIVAIDKTWKACPLPEEMKEAIERFNG